MIKHLRNFEEKCKFLTQKRENSEITRKVKKTVILKEKPRKKLTFPKQLQISRSFWISKCFESSTNFDENTNTCTFQRKFQRFCLKSGNAANLTKTHSLLKCVENQQIM